MAESTIAQPRVRGRDMFQRAHPLLLQAERIVNVLPLPIRITIFEWIRHVPGLIGLALRYIVLRGITHSCGSVVAVFEGAYLRNPLKLELGKNVSIHPMCYLDATGGLSIGDDVSIAHGVTIMTTEHTYSDIGTNIREAAGTLASVSIGSDVWIGAGVKVLAGVTVGDHVVIGAGAVVTKDIPSGSLAVGVPAKVIKQIRVSNEA